MDNNACEREEDEEAEDQVDTRLHRKSGQANLVAAPQPNHGYNQNGFNPQPNTFNAGQRRMRP